MPDSHSLAVVLGGSGFVGRRLVAMLADPSRPEWPRFERVRTADLAPFGSSLPEEAEHVRCDVRSKDDLRRALAGADTVFHLASLVHVGLSKNPVIDAVNVEGTRNVVEVCKELGVKFLVYTSSEDVVLDTRPVSGGDESLPYPSQPIHDYVRTKIEGERVALGANSDALATCSVRPTHIYGPNDPHAITTSLKEFSKGTMPLLIGDPSARFDCVYVDNVAHAHLLAAAKLHDPATRAAVAGRAYFINEGYAPNFFDFLRPFAKAKGLTVPTRRLPKRVAFAIADAFALVHRVTGIEPPFHRFHMYVIGQDFYFRSDRAKRELGYEPIVSTDEALARTTEWVKTLSL